MKKVLIKRVKRPQKPVGAKAKILAGLGVGATLAGFSGASSKAGQNLKPIVRTQEKEKNLKKEKITQSLKDIFGVKEAKAGWDDGPGDWDEGDLSLSPRHTNFYISGGGGPVGSASAYTAQVLGQDPTNQSNSALLESLQSNPSGQYSMPSPASSSNTVSNEQTLINNYIKDQEQRNGLKIISRPDGSYEVTGGAYNINRMVSTQEMLRLAQLWANPTPDPLANLPVSQNNLNLQLLNPFAGSVGMNENGQPIYFNNGAYTDANGNVYGKFLDNGVWVYRQNVIESPPTEATPPVQQQASSGLGNVIAVAEDGTALYANPNDRNSYLSADNKIYVNGPNGQPVQSVEPNPFTITVTEKFEPIPTLQAVMGLQGQVRDVNGNLVYVDSNGHYQSNSGQLNYVNGQYQVAVPTDGEFRTGINGKNYYYISAIGDWVNSEGERWGVSSPNIGAVSQTGLNPNLQSVGEENGTTIYFNNKTGKFQDASGQRIYTGDYNAQGDYSFSEINQQAGQNNQNVDTSTPVNLDSARNNNIIPGAGSENSLNPVSVNQSALDAKKQIEEMVQTNLSGLSGFVPQKSEVSQTLEFTPITLYDGTKVTTTNGVDYKDSNGNSYFYTGVQGTDLMRYNATTGAFTYVKPVVLTGSGETQNESSGLPIGISQTTEGSGEASPVTNLTQSVISKAGNKLQNTQEKIGDGINAGIGTITGVFKGDNSNKPDNLNLDPSKLKTLKKFAVIGGASVVAGPVGGAVVGIASGSQTTWDKLVDWATDPKNINRPGTVTWTDPTTKEKFSFSKFDIQNAFILMQNFGIEP